VAKERYIDQLTYLKKFEKKYTMTSVLLSESLFSMLREKSIDFKDIEIVVDNAAVPSSKQLRVVASSSMSSGNFHASCNTLIGDYDQCESDSEDEDEDGFRYIVPRNEEEQKSDTWKSSRWESEARHSDKVSPPSFPARKCPSDSPLKSSLAKHHTQTRLRRPRSLRASSTFLSPSSSKELEEVLTEAIDITEGPPPPPVLSPTRSILKSTAKPDGGTSLSSPKFQKSCRKAKLVF
jgi:hypothetical protein